MCCRMPPGAHYGTLAYEVSVGEQRIKWKFRPHLYWWQRDCFLLGLTVVCSLLEALGILISISIALITHVSFTLIFCALSAFCLILLRGIYVRQLCGRSYRHSNEWHRRSVAMPGFVFVFQTLLLFSATLTVASCRDSVDYVAEVMAAALHLGNSSLADNDAGPRVDFFDAVNGTNDGEGEPLPLLCNGHYQLVNLGILGLFAHWLLVALPAALFYTKMHIDNTVSPLQNSRNYRFTIDDESGDDCESMDSRNDDDDYERSPGKRVVGHLLYRKRNNRSKNNGNTVAMRTYDNGNADDGADVSHWNDHFSSDDDDDDDDDNASMPKRPAPPPPVSDTLKRDVPVIDPSAAELPPPPVENKKTNGSDKQPEIPSSAPPVAENGNMVQQKHAHFGKKED